MPNETSRAQAKDETRIRILEVAREVLGQNPDAGIGDIATAAGVVRRTVYWHFPARTDLVRTLAEQAAAEMTAVLSEVAVDGVPADAAWADFVARLWPLAHRYRVLLALRRSEQGDEIHATLQTVDRILADLIRRGQDTDAFERHLPAEPLGRIAYATVFAIADDRRASATLGVGAATITSLLLLGVPASRAYELADPSRSI